LIPCASRDNAILIADPVFVNSGWPSFTAPPTCCRGRGGAARAFAHAMTVDSEIGDAVRRLEAARAAAMP